MGDARCPVPPTADGGPHLPPGAHGRYRRVLWIALLVNAGMFAVEITAGSTARSSALLADAVDFFGDAGNYAISLLVLGASLRRRAQASLLKGISMGALALGVTASAIHRLATGSVPEPLTMGVVGTLALAANVGVAALLFRWRSGDSNMRSVWLASRNDAIGNVAVAAAALGVFATRTGWPDTIVAFTMAALELSAAVQVVAHARKELRAAAARHAPCQNTRQRTGVEHGDAA